jgi:hypothetical protein
VCHTIFTSRSENPSNPPLRLAPLVRVPDLPWKIEREDAKDILTRKQRDD